MVSIMRRGRVSVLHLLLLSWLLFVALPGRSDGVAEEVLSLKRFPEEKIGPSSWSYYRVELPVRFSLLMISLTQHWSEDARADSEETVPLVCFGFNGPPLVMPPKSSLLEALIAAGSTHNASVPGECAWFIETMTVNVTNMEVLSGMLHIGIFSDSKPTRTQSQMISRGKEYTFGLEVQVLGCPSEAFGGPGCNLRIKALPPSSDRGPESDTGNDSFHNTNERRDNFTEDTTRPDGTSSRQECMSLGESRYFSLYMMNFVSELEINFHCSWGRSSSGTGEGHQNSSQCQEIQEGLNDTTVIQLRYGAIPDTFRSDYTGNLSSRSLTVESPRRGWWYLAISIPHLISTQTSGRETEGLPGDEVCLTFNWTVGTCGPTQMGNDCQWSASNLDRLMMPEVESPFDSFYFPTSRIEALEVVTKWFPLQTLNASTSIATSERWEYVTLEVPTGAAGGALSIYLTSETMNGELYARYESCPTNRSWDFSVTKMDSEGLTSHLADRQELGNDATYIWMQKTPKNLKLSLDVLYPKEGLWCLGVRYVMPSTSNGEIVPEQDAHETYSASPEVDMEMLVYLHGCLNRCSGHGRCHVGRDASRLHYISYCHCDVAHGDFDCSAILVGPGKELRQIWALTLSNAAAILPSMWAIRHQAYSEWITFMLSGMASAVYHSCDSGGWCALSFSTLQFLDFWLSFLVIIMTCLYMAGFDGPKDMMHIGFAVLTATIAKENATSVWNVVVVVIIGTLVLLSGWSIEAKKVVNLRGWQPSLNSFSTIWVRLSGWSHSYYLQLVDRHSWLYVGLGTFFLFNAILSLYMEVAQTYWIWHSWWHVSIYTSAACYLLSILPKIDAQSHVYEVVSQESSFANSSDPSELTYLPQNHES